jgi:sporulation protein YlmC with PRC-barrel domain
MMAWRGDQAMTMDIPIGVDVECADGACGKSSYAIVNPIRREITHIVVEPGGLLVQPERLVPLDLVVESTPSLIRLNCTKDEFEALEPFVDLEYIKGDLSDFDYAGEYLLAPYRLPDAVLTPVEVEQIPPDELAVRRGARVEATDGHVGRVDEFLIDPESEHITHLVMREGHLWGQRDVTIPISKVDRMEEDTVYLKLDKGSVEALPTIPVRR